MLIFALHAPMLPLVAKGPSFPTPYVVGVTAVGGVARTVPAYTAIPTTTTNEAKTNLDLISSPFPDEPALACIRLYAPSADAKRQNH